MPRPRPPHPLRRPRAHPRSPARERGAFVVVTALVMLLLVLAIALALDSGRLYLEQRHMQRVADLAALEAAGKVVLISQTSDAALTAAAADAAKRNGHDPAAEGRVLEVAGGGICHEAVGGGKVRAFFAHGVGAAAIDCGVHGGQYSGTLERHALRVSARHTVSPSLFGSLWGEEAITVAAMATAQRPRAEPYGVLSVGTRLLAVDAAASPLLGPVLSGLLGGAPTASLVGFDGLANARVSVAELLEVKRLTVGSVDELLATELTVLELVEAARIGAGGDELLALDALEGLLGASVGGVDIALGELLEVGTAQVPLAAELDVLDLLDAAILAANKGRAIVVENLALGIPGLADIDLVLDVIEPPQIAIGPVGCADGAPPPAGATCNGQWKTTARTAQVRLGVSGALRIPVLADLGLKAGLLAGGAKAGIEDARRPTSGTHAWDVDVAAWQYPLGGKLDLKLDVLDTSLPWLDPGLVSDNGLRAQLNQFLEQLGLANTLLGNLVSTVESLLGGLLGALLDLLKGILGLLASSREYYNPGTDEICVEATAVLGLIKRTRCQPAPHLPGELGPGGETPDWNAGLDTWLASVEADTSSTSMTPAQRSLAWPEQTDARFAGSIAATAASLGALLGDIDLQAEFFGGRTSSLLTPVLAIVDAVAGEVLAAVAATALDPLLDALGVQVNDAEVRVIHIDDHTGAPELLQ